MSLYDYLTGQQSWTSYVNNRDIGRQFEMSPTKAGNMILRISASDWHKAIAEGLGSITNGFSDATEHLQYEISNVSAGVEALRADFHVLMGDVIWKLEMQTTVLADMLHALQAPLNTAAKELRQRAEYAYRNGRHEEALKDFSESEKTNYQDFSVHRSLGNIFLALRKNLTDPLVLLRFDDNGVPVPQLS
jgi:hypothetical protein